MLRNLLSKAPKTNYFTKTPSRSFTRAPEFKRRTYPAIILGAGLATGLSWLGYKQRNVSCVTTDKASAGSIRKGLPVYKLSEIAKHDNPANGVWVTYKNGVYDITEFMASHPGGPEKIRLAAGSAIEPYWEVFAAHNTDEVREMLEELRIGNIHPDDQGKTPQGGNKEGPYANDPIRPPILKINTETPFNAETPIVLLPESFITPNNLFFIRNHLPVPDVKPRDYVLEVVVPGKSPVKLTLDDLKTKFKQHSVTAAIQCAGNRRSELADVKKVKGLNWTGGAIGNAQWRGVRLRDVLEYAGMDFENESIKHVHFEGLDTNSVTGERYGASVPVEKAADPRGDCLLATEMNGEPLPRDHGYPMRALIPGVVGARNVKWLSRIEAHPQEYQGHWQQRDYKGFSPNVDWDTVDFSTAPAIQELPVTSLICSPQEGALLERGDESVSVKGVAWSGGGREVIRVDVSGDGGKTWNTATLDSEEKQPLGRAWAWKQWEVEVPLSSSGDLQLCCKAVDVSYNVQPDTPGPIWNLRGCLSNAWHRVNCSVK